ncbi:Uncharacterised protein [uncultured archaeon]|nr:Uncharacterised protein [uncultured archaeon]
MTKVNMNTEGTNISFDEDLKTGEVSMFVCGELYTKKNPRLMRKPVLEAFKDEIIQHQGFICPTDLDGS